MARNKYFSTDGPHSYLTEYSVTLCNVLKAITPDQLESALRVLKAANNIYVCGNGGSAAIADHWACDIQKGLSGVHHARTPHVTSLTAHTGLITAIANDLTYTEIFAEQLRMRGADRTDVLVAISASGNSPNVVGAATFARTRFMPVIGMTGFNGGLVRDLSDVQLHIDCPNYGVVEDAHSALMHCIAQFWYRTEVDRVACGAI